MGGAQRFTVLEQLEYDSLQRHALKLIKSRITLPTLRRCLMVQRYVHVLERNVLTTLQ